MENPDDILLDWQLINFEECVYNKTPNVEKIKQSEYKIYGKYPVVDQSQLYIAGYNDDSNKVYNGILPVIIFGDHTRIVKYIDFPFICGADGTKVIIPNKEKIHPKFFYFSLLNTHIEDRGYNRHFSLLKQKQIPLPSSIEQYNIAHILSTIQRSIEATEKVISSTQELKKSLMQHLFSYGPVPPEKADQVPLKETEIGMVPEHWEVASIGEIYDFSKKPSHIDLSKYNKIPFIPMDHIPDYTENTNPSYYDKSSRDITTGTFFFKGDLLIAKITPSFENGKQCITSNIPNDFGYATTEVWPLQEKKEGKSNIFYLYNYLLLNSVRTKVAGKMEGSTGRQRVPKNVIKNLQLPLPPKNEQEIINETLFRIKEKVVSEKNRKIVLQSLFNSMLHHLMTGKLRVSDLDLDITEEAVAE